MWAKKRWLKLPGHYLNYEHGKRANESFRDAKLKAFSRGKGQAIFPLARPMESAVTSRV